MATKTSSESALTPNTQNNSSFPRRIEKEINYEQGRQSFCIINTTILEHATQNFTARGQST